MENFKVGQTVIYDDGREGHRGVKALVLEVGPSAMVVQFEDAERAWMDFIRFN